MALDHELEALSAQVEGARAQRFKLLAKWQRRIATIAAYKRTFLMPDGSVRPDAIPVLADIADHAQLGRASTWAAPASDAELREREGARRLALHILSSLDLSGELLRDLSRKTREQKT